MKQVIEETHQQRQSGVCCDLPLQTAPLLPGRTPQRECTDRGPHLHLRDIRVGENCLRIYQSGYELYDAMLQAIDGAQESIYLES